jgi:L-fuculose-phosphate aldolase
VSWDDVRAEIVEACHRLEAEELVGEASGNVSVRLPAKDGRELVAITPSQVPYRILMPEQVLVTDFEGNVIEGEGAPSSERKVHFAAYKARSDVGSVIHSHSVYASACAMVGMEIPAIIDEGIVGLGPVVKCAPYALSATDDLANGAVEALGLRQAVLLQNHGVVNVGRDLNEAVSVAALVERTAKIFVIAKQLGDVKTLPDNIVGLMEKYRRIQHGLPAEAEPNA